MVQQIFSDGNNYMCTDFTSRVKKHGVYVGWDVPSCVVSSHVFEFCDENGELVELEIRNNTTDSFKFVMDGSSVTLHPSCGVRFHLDDDGVNLMCVIFSFEL